MNQNNLQKRDSGDGTDDTQKPNQTLGLVDVKPDNKLDTNIVTYQSPGELLALAINKDFDIDRLKILMELQERWEANEARKAYVKDMAEFKKNPPKIYKDMLVEFKTRAGGTTSYTHPSLGNIVGCLTEALAKHRFSSAWKMKQNEKNMLTVANIITHSQGHSETVEMTSPLDPSQYMNPMQALASTKTYLERYTFMANTGSASNEAETDGRMPSKKHTVNGQPDWKPDEKIDEVKSVALDIIEKLHNAKELSDNRYGEWKSWAETQTKVKMIQDQIDTVLRAKLKKIDQDKPDKAKEVKDKEPEKKSDSEIDPELDKLITALIKQVKTLFANDEQKRNGWLKTIESCNTINTANAIKSSLDKIMEK